MNGSGWQYSTVVINLNFLKSMTVILCLLLDCNSKYIEPPLNYSCQRIKLRSNQATDCNNYQEIWGGGAYVEEYVKWHHEDAVSQNRECGKSSRTDDPVNLTNE